MRVLDKVCDKLEWKVHFAAETFLKIQYISLTFWRLPVCMDFKIFTPKQTFNFIFHEPLKCPPTEQMHAQLWQASLLTVLGPAELPKNVLLDPRGHEWDVTWHKALCKWTKRPSWTVQRPCTCSPVWPQDSRTEDHREQREGAGRRTSSVAQGHLPYSPSWHPDFCFWSPEWWDNKWVVLLLSFW